MHLLELESRQFTKTFHRGNENLVVVFHFQAQFPHRTGFVLLTALRNSEEYLAGMAAAGAYLAPMLLGDAESVSLLLAYSLVVSAAVSWAALLRGWRLTFIVVILGYFLMGAFAWDADAAWRSLYITVGGGVLLAAALWRNWMLAALLAWHLAWVSAMASTPGIEGWGAWLLVVGPAALVWPIWRRAIGVSSGTGARLHADERWGLVATTMFYATAVAWAVVATQALPPPADCCFGGDPAAASAVAAWKLPACPLIS